VTEGGDWGGAFRYAYSVLMVICIRKLLCFRAHTYIRTGTEGSSLTFF